MTTEIPITELVFFVVNGNRANEFPAALAKGAAYLRGPVLAGNWRPGPSRDAKFSR
jgi:hypothetical protein